MLEAESEGEARRTAGAVPSPALAVPASLHASLMARLDRLGPAKEVAQVGAAIGREFSHALLAAVVRKPEVELNRRWTGSSTLVCCSGRACRRMRLIYSSTPWCRTRPMARCCASRDAHFMLASPKPLKPIRGDCREPTRTARASLHRGRADREGRGSLGQGGTAVARAFRAA